MDFFFWLYGFCFFFYGYALELLTVRDGWIDEACIVGDGDI